MMGRSLRGITSDEWHEADQWWDQRADRTEQAPVEDVEGVVVSKCERCGHLHREGGECVQEVA